jgi:hypothetical protein
MTAIFTAMVSGGFDLNMLVLDFSARRPLLDADWWADGAGFRGGAEGERREGRIVSFDGRNPPEAHAADLLRRGIVPIHGIARH